jgi:NAD(P)-dependent dehydrogenase (short-subunit alcohol dehydrogenase family)
VEKVTEIFNLYDKVAIVTGGTRGLGESVAELFLDAGAKVVITGRDEGIGKETAARLGANGAEISYVRQDVAEESEWKRVIEHSLGTYGGLDILVNNAGLHWLGPLEKESLDSFRKMQQVNVEGTFIGIKEAMSVMKPGGAAGNGGSIINVSSIAGLIGFASHGAYSASKGSVRSLSKVAAMECAHFGYGIRVNSIYPGVIPTEMADGLWDEVINLGMASNKSEASAVMTSLHPLGLGEASDVAAACLYLASNASKWVTGAELVLDGGFTAS